MVISSYHHITLASASYTGTELNIPSKKTHETEIINHIRQKKSILCKPSLNAVNIEPGRVRRNLVHLLRGRGQRALLSALLEVRHLLAPVTHSIGEADGLLVGDAGVEGDAHAVGALGDGGRVDGEDPEALQLQVQGEEVVVARLRQDGDDVREDGLVLPLVGDGDVEDAGLCDFLVVRVAGQGGVEEADEALEAEAGLTFVSITSILMSRVARQGLTGSVSPFWRRR